MRKVKRFTSILLHTPMNSNNPRITRITCTIRSKLQPCASKPVLALEHTCIIDRHLQRLVACAVESIRSHGGERQDLRPFEIVAFDVVGVEGRRGCVEGGEDVCDGDTAVEEDGAFY